MKTVKFAQVLKFSENLVKVDKPEEERYVTVLLYGRGVIEREIKEGKVPVAFTGYKAHAGQLIISTINARNGAAGIIPAELDGAVVSKDFPLFDIDHECVDEQYLLYYLWSDSFIHKAEQNSFGATMPRLHVKPFLNMQMRLPALSEQKRRAHTLCHVESLLNTQSHLLTKLDELVKSRFVEMFAGKYETVKLGNVAKTTSGGTPSRTHPEYYEKGSIPWLTSGEVNAGVITSVKNYITEAAMENSSAKMVPANSVVVAMYGATAGVTGLLRLNTTTNQAVCSILPNERFVPEYLYYAVASKKDWMISQCQGGGQPNISQGIIRSMEIIDAPLELQNRFAAFVAEVDKSKLAVQQSLEKLEMLKKSLMQQYFG